MGGRLLGCMGRVDDDRVTQLPHLRDGGDVADQTIVTEGCAAFDEDDVLVAVVGDLVDDVLHIARGHELSLFNLNAFARFGGGFDQVGLTGQQGGDLVDVEDCTGRCCLVGQMNVRDDRDGKFLADHCEDVQSGVEAGATETVYTGPIGLIETGFEYEADIQLGGEVLESRGDLEAEVFALDHTGTGDKDQRSAGAHGTFLNVFIAYCEGFHIESGGS